MSLENQRVLLAVLAHPDDETFGIGGTLALYASRGVAVHLVCATRGEAGEVDPQLLQDFASVAERRVSELRCAAEILGLAGVHFLDYRDSGMPGSPDNQHPRALVNAPLEEAAGRVAHYIRLLKPQVIITDDPIGGYKHPDHIAIHKITVRAFSLAGDPEFRDGVPGQDELPPYQPQKLYYRIFPRGFLRYAVRLLPLLGQDPRKFGRNGDIDLLSLVQEGEFPVHASIEYNEVADKRQAASACHASQLGDRGMPRRGPLAWLLRLSRRKEPYMRAVPPVEGKIQEHDLFEGI